MPPEPYDAWISIYNDEIRATWESEREELRKVSMIYCAFQYELHKLKSGLNNEIEELRSELKRRDYLQKSKSFVGLAKSQLFDVDIDTDKENEIPESVPLQDVQSEDIIIESPNTSTFFNLCKSPPLITNVAVSTSGKSCSNSDKKKSPGSNLYPMISYKIDKTPKSSEVRQDFKTPFEPNDTNIMECSIIDETPDIKPAIKKGKNSKFSLLRLSSRNKSKLSQSKQKATLTQMFTLQSPKKKKKKREIDSNGPSMSINAMIDLINESSSSATEDDLDKTTDFDDLEVSSFVKKYDKVSEKKNDSPDYVYNEVVRGKERRKLKGWACVECEDYYKGFDLPPEEIEKKKDQCSRHRHKFQGGQDTFKGFWDLTFKPTPKTPEEKSLVFNYKKT